MHGAVLVACRLDPAPARLDVAANAREVLLDALLWLELALLVQVKVGQPVVDHEQGRDVGGLDAGLVYLGLCQLHGVDAP